jgi:glycosyltransferase involved in cell wall biosynthesis
MADIPAVSVVIPLYNKGPHIARALNSVLAQTFQDFEVIVVDDGSTDDGAGIVRGFDDPRIRLIQQANQGVSAARNRGVEGAEAELVAFLDADDEWLPKHLETINRLRAKHPEAGAYATASKMRKSDGSEIWPAYKRIPKRPWEGLLPSYFLSSALGKYPVNSSVIAIPKEIYTDVGGCPAGIRWGEDADLWGKIALKYPIAFSWELGAIYHLNAANRACKQALPLEKEPVVLTLQRAIMRGEVHPEKTHEIREYIYKRELARATRCVLSGNRTEARNIIFECHTRYLHTRKIIALILLIMPTGLSQFMWNKACQLLNIEG